MTSFIEEFIKKSAGRLIKVINFEAEVVSVDKAKDTIKVQPVEGDEIPDVKLKSILSDNTKKIVFYPAVGSFVTVSLLRNSEVDFYVTGYSEVEEAVINCDNIVINGGENGGVVKWNPDDAGGLKEELDRVKDMLTHLTNVINGAAIPEPGSGAPSALQASLKAAILMDELPTFEDLQDDKLKH
jgi:hypothetical protein